MVSKQKTYFLSGRCEGRSNISSSHTFLGVFDLVNCFVSLIDLQDIFENSGRSGELKINLKFLKWISRLKHTNANFNSFYIYI